MKVPWTTGAVLTAALLLAVGADTVYSDHKGKPHGKPGGGGGGTCGTGLGPLFTTIPPLGSRTYETTATYHAKTTAIRAAEQRGRPLTPEACYSFEGNEWMSIRAPDSEFHRFRVMHCVLAEDLSLTKNFKRVRFMGGGPSIRTADLWTGTILSNEIELKLLPPGPKMPTPRDVLRQVGSLRVGPLPTSTRPTPQHRD